MILFLLILWCLCCSVLCLLNWLCVGNGWIIRLLRIGCVKWFCLWWLNSVLFRLVLILCLFVCFLRIRLWWVRMCRMYCLWFGVWCGCWKVYCLILLLVCGWCLIGWCRKCWLVLCRLFCYVRCLIVRCGLCVVLWIGRCLFVMILCRCRYLILCCCMFVLLVELVWLVDVLWCLICWCECYEWNYL